MGAIVLFIIVRYLYTLAMSYKIIVDAKSKAIEKAAKDSIALQATVDAKMSSNTNCIECHNDCVTKCHTAMNATSIPASAKDAEVCIKNCIQSTCPECIEFVNNVLVTSKDF